MKTQILFPEAGSEALSFTLLSTLWQGLIILIVLKAILKFIPTGRSALRYTLIAIAMLTMLIGALVTFGVFYQPSEQGFSNTSLKYTFPQGAAASHNSLIGWSGPLTSFILLYKNYIITGWFAGTLIFILRLAGGWWYLYKLRISSSVLHNEWSARLARIAMTLKIKISIQLAESAQLLTPIVIGILKPVIIIPAGLTTGLSTEQIESIFLHELIHIKRQDYLLNVLQSILEALFFFNPFVWQLSGMLRTEREHCCDDAVIQTGVNAKAYVKALASLEEARFSNTHLAVSFAGNQTELLDRIKRLMENSVKNYSLREKVIPVLLLLIGLVCASWFKIQKNPEAKSVLSADLSAEKLVAADTSIKKKHKSAVYSRKKSVVTPPNGIPHEEIVESFEGDEELKSMLNDFDFNLDLALPPVPELHPIPDFDFTLAIPAIPAIPFMFDTIPPVGGTRQDWEAFQRDFQEKFKQRFSDFYTKNQGEIEKIMEEVQKKHLKDREWISQLEEGARSQAMHMHEQALQLKDQQSLLADQQNNLKKMEGQMQQWEKQYSEQMKNLDAQMKKFEEKMKAFDVDLKKELVRDGYLESSEPIEIMSWDDEGDIEINGKKIKEADKKKYWDLHKKHFGEDGGHFKYVK
jgi:bla regulator protein blaR1